MAIDYAAIKSENILGYGTKVARYGPKLLANRYDNRTHFIFELLQNAEDAIQRRHGQLGSRVVAFALDEGALRVSHFGEPFTEEDVRSICGIGESTKSEDLTAIGQFGIGFKSVYAITDSPEIHSGDEHFTIDSFVWPRLIEPSPAKPGETVFLFPFSAGDQTAYEHVKSGLQDLGVRSLLFLREIEEITWAVGRDRSGQYLRGKSEPVGKSARKIVLVGQESAQQEVTEEMWLVFSRAIKREDGASAGHVEIAFEIDKDESGQNTSVRRVPDSPLVVFFPTIVQTHLGFLVQGPYRTTLSRDNVPHEDPWNQHLVRETAELLVDALRELRELGLLDTEALRALPIDASKFAEGTMLAPLFTAVQIALSSEPLLPRHGGGHVSATHARLATTEPIRKLLSPHQLKSLFQTDHDVAWLVDEITQYRTPELRKYLMQELEISELDPEGILRALSREFLVSQSDQWLADLYEFLDGQSSLRGKIKQDDKPIIRLEDGSHVPPWQDEQPQAFLPGAASTDFPTVKRSICTRDSARLFLKNLGLSEPNPVDDIIRNLVPKYRDRKSEVPNTDYESDIARMLYAFRTDLTKSQRERLLLELRQTPFVAALDTGDGSPCLARPTDVYIPTQRLKELFQGVPAILVVDESCDCLGGSEVRELLEACGAAGSLLREPFESEFTYQELADMRKSAGTEDSRGGDEVEDFTLRGLQELMDILPALGPEQAARKSALLWEALCDVQETGGPNVLSGTYRWRYVQSRRWNFDACFVRLLNEKAWVPDSTMTLTTPASVVFEDISPAWKANLLLRSKIKFKPSVIEELARELGIEPGVLDLLKTLGITNVVELRARLSLKEESPDDAGHSGVSSKGPTEGPLDIPASTTPPAIGQETELQHGVENEERLQGRIVSAGYSGSPPSESGSHPTDSKIVPSITRDRAIDATQQSSSFRPFISYVGAHPKEDEPDPDGLDQASRLALEEKAIGLILNAELELRRTPPNNPGFDLVQLGTHGNAVKWIEVKSMTGTLLERSVGLSRTQFECARQHGPAFWLYVVERAGSPKGANIVRIQDPVGKARTFTFDHGWISVADR